VVKKLSRFARATMEVGITGSLLSLFLCSGLGSCTKLVTARTEDLTNASHASILEEETEQVGEGCPVRTGADGRGLCSQN